MKKIFLPILIMMYILSQLSVSSFSSELTEENLNIIKIDKEIYANANNETIPVCIWYRDIDQEMVEDIVEEEIGYSKDKITVDLPTIGTREVEQLYNVELTSDNNIDILSNYVEENSLLIEMERERTNKYISCRREKAKEMYIEKSRKIITHTGIITDVEFISKYAPMIIAKLSLNQIKSLSENEDVLEIKYYNENVKYVECSGDRYDFDNYIAKSNIDLIHNELGLTGFGVSVGIAEKQSFEPHVELPTTRCFTVGDSYYDTGHATNTARIISGTRGVAPNSKLYSLSFKTLENAFGIGVVNFYNGMERLIDENVSVINISFGFLNSNSSYSDIDRWADHVANYHNITIIASAGNIDNDNPNGVVLSPGKADNVITVGNCSNMFTETISDDVMAYDSCFNETGGCEKPEIVACGNIGGGGTSSSAPVVAGTVALMLELRPSLAAFPEAIKAILMASCQYKALPASGDTNEAMNSGITEKQGAGVFSPYLSICITGQGNYGVGVLDAYEVSKDIKFVQPKYGAEGMNLSLTWLRNNKPIKDDHLSDVNVEARKNLNLELFKNNSSVKSSRHASSSAEMIYYTNLSNTSTNYTIRITQIDNYAESTRYAYAWCLNDEMFQKVDDLEGLYYLKNVGTDNYLTYKNSSSSYELGSLSYSNNQLFVLNKVPENNNYNILNGYNEGGITYNSSVVSSTMPSEIQMIRSHDTDGFFYLRSGDYFIYSMNASNATSVRWELIADINANKLWMLEKVAYRRGDVNMDNVINSIDANVILQYASRVIDITNAQNFLGDINNDNSINSHDALEVLNIAAN